MNDGCSLVFLSSGGPEKNHINVFNNFPRYALKKNHTIHYQFKFIVFENGSLRHFTTAKSMIADDSNWVYSIGKSLKENYFGKYME